MMQVGVSAMWGVRRALGIDAYVNRLMRNLFRIIKIENNKNITHSSPRYAHTTTPPPILLSSKLQKSPCSPPLNRSISASNARSFAPPRTPSRAPALHGVDEEFGTLLRSGGVDAVPEIHNVVAASPRLEDRLRSLLNRGLGTEQHHGVQVPLDADLVTYRGKKRMEGNTVKQTPKDKAQGRGRDGGGQDVFAWTCCKNRNKNMQGPGSQGTRGMGWPPLAHRCAPALPRWSRSSRGTRCQPRWWPCAPAARQTC